MEITVDRGGETLPHEKVEVLEGTTIIHDDKVYTVGDQFEIDGRVAVAWYLAKQVKFVS